MRITKAASEAATSCNQCLGITPGLLCPPPPPPAANAWTPFWRQGPKWAHLKKVAIDNGNYLYTTLGKYHEWTTVRRQGYSLNLGQPTYLLYDVVQSHWCGSAHCGRLRGQTP